MSDFRGGLALDLVVLGRFQAPRGGCHRYSGRFDVNSTLICFAAVRFDTISTLFDIPIVNFRLCNLMEGLPRNASALGVNRLLRMERVLERGSFPSGVGKARPWTARGPAKEKQ